MCGLSLPPSVYRLLPLLPGTVCRGFQLIVRWKTSLTQTRPACSWRTLSSGPTMRSRLQPIMEQAGAPTATKSLNGHCKEVRATHRALYQGRPSAIQAAKQKDCRKRHVTSFLQLYKNEKALFVFANSIHYLQHHHIRPLGNVKPAPQNLWLIVNPIICFKQSN